MEEESFFDERRAEIQKEILTENELKIRAREALKRELEKNDENEVKVNDESEVLSINSMDSVNFVDDGHADIDGIFIDENSSVRIVSDEEYYINLEEKDKTDSIDFVNVENEEPHYESAYESASPSAFVETQQSRVHTDTLENMREEVIVAIECYCTVINNSLATAKMIEIALECIGLLISNRYVIGSTIISQEEDVLKENKDTTSEERRKIGGIMDLISSICECADNPAEAVQVAMSKDLLSLMTSPVCQIHESGMLKAVRTVFHIYLITKHEEARQTSRAVLQDMLKSVFQRMEAYDAILDKHDDLADVELSKTPNVDSNATLFASRFHTDSYLLFRALCKLSAKTLPEDVEETSSSNGSTNHMKIFSSNKSGGSDPMATDTKILSLELIVCVFEHCGTAFCNGPKFIYAVQNFLCVSLLKNCISSNTRVAHLSLQIFLLLVSEFNFMRSRFVILCINVLISFIKGLQV